MKTSFLTLFVLVTGTAFAQHTEKADSTKYKKYKPKISGVIQVHYLNEFNTNHDSIRDPDGFRILRARLTATGKIADKITYELMIDPRAPEQGGILRDAYLSFHQLKNQEIRIGQQKTQFGWENRESVTRLFTVNRAEMSDAVSRGENLRDIGIGIIGHIPLRKKWRFENAVTFTNGTRMNVTAPYDFNPKKMCWGRFGVRYKKHDVVARIGSSFGFGGIRYLNDLIYDPSDDIYATVRRFGVDAQLDHPFFFFAAEYAMGTDVVKDTLFAEPFGYQAILAVKTKWNAGPMVRYDITEDEWKVITVGAWYGLPKDRLRFLVNYVFRGGVTDIPGGHDDRLYIQAQVSF